MPGLTREQMEKEIERGRSISHNGNIITRKEDLPKPEELADTPEARAKADEDLAAEIARLQARRDSLKAEAMVRKPDETLVNQHAAVSLGKVESTKDAPKATDKAK